MNALSSDLGYRGMAVAAAIAVIFLGTDWVRQLPSHARLIRIVSWGLLGGAAIAVVVGVVNRGWEGPATITATTLTLAAVLIPTDRDKAARLLGGVAIISFGVAFIGYGVAFLRDDDVLGGIVFIGLGVATIVYGAAFLRGNAVLSGAACIGVGVAFIGGGIDVLRDDDVLLGVGLIGLGVAFIGFGAAFLRDSEVLGWVALIGSGVAVINLGVAFLRDGWVLVGAAGIGCAVAVIGLGVVGLRRTGILVPIVTWLVSPNRAASGEVSPSDGSPVGDVENSSGSRDPTPKPPHIA